jgi:hypothetical protein
VARRLQTESRWAPGVRRTAAAEPHVPDWECAALRKSASPARLAYRQPARRPHATLHPATLARAGRTGGNAPRHPNCANHSSCRSSRLNSASTHASPAAPLSMLLSDIGVEPAELSQLS